MEGAVWDAHEGAEDADVIAIAIGKGIVVDDSTVPCCVIVPPDEADEIEEKDEEDGADADADADADVAPASVPIALGFLRIIFRINSSSFASQTEVSSNRTARTASFSALWRIKLSTIAWIVPIYLSIYVYIKVLWKLNINMINK